jgi:hypothetical protein
VTSYEKLKLRCEVAEKALALRANDTPAHQLALAKALDAYEAAKPNDVGSAIAKALLGRDPVVNLLKASDVAKASEAPEDLSGASITARNRIRRAGGSEPKKVTINDGVSSALKNPPKINMLYKED